MSNVKVAELTLTEAQVVLQRAEQRDKQERRDALIKQLAEVHAAREKAQAEYQFIAGKVKAEREEKHRLRFQIEHVDGLLGQHAKNRPRVADYLPGDKDAIAWQQEHDMMESARATLMEQLRNVPNSFDANAAQYEGPFGLLAQLEYSEHNLLNALDPAGRDAWLKGGVFAVSDM